MEEVQGSRHFQISKAIFTDMKGPPGRLDVADATDAVEVEEFSTEYEAFGRARELP